MKSKVIQSLNYLLEEMGTKENNIIRINIYYGKAEVHLKNGIENVGIVNVALFDSEKFPYKLYVEFSGIEFFEIVSESEMKERFPELLGAEVNA